MGINSEKGHFVESKATDQAPVAPSSLIGQLLSRQASRIGQGLHHVRVSLYERERARKLCVHFIDYVDSRSFLTLIAIDSFTTLGRHCLNNASTRLYML